ncbi:MAG: hypothetical protein JSR81_16050 [Proteobacteria bacterium]|nr:hypothetical protein [Pseudomonadota bacterium]
MASDMERKAAIKSGELGAAESIALAGASRAKTDAYLDEQTRLARLQAENLIDQNAYELSHLRWRRFNDQISGALRIIAVIFGVLLLLGLATVLWRAHEADGLVVGAFSVPPDLLQAGMSGGVVADDLTQKLATIRRIGNGQSFDQTSDVQSDLGDEFKVQIPETGISLSEAWRALKSWLGHEHAMSGNVRDLGDGRVALTVSYDGAGTASFTGAKTNLGALEQRAGEYVFSLYSPNNYVFYLQDQGHLREALALEERWSGRLGIGFLSLTGNTLRYLGKPRLAIARERYVLAVAGDNPMPRWEILNASEELGDTESTLTTARKLQTYPAAAFPPSFSKSSIEAVLRDARQAEELALGDFSAAQGEDFCLDCDPAERLLARAALDARLHDVQRSRGEIALARDSGRLSAERLGHARERLAEAEGEWTGAVHAAGQYVSALTDTQGVDSRIDAVLARTEAMPLRARALAHTGDFAGAHAQIDKTPGDCDLCLRVRGEIDALQKNDVGAGYWFARAVKQAPDIPFAYADWGEMLLHEGKYDDAIAKFEAANRKGPHFADPLEMWGEALIAKDRSDLALAKFAEAGKYVPNWGRLHLKWGEALLWSGDKSGAQKQFAIAAHLDLTRSEKSELAKERGHG